MEPWPGVGCAASVAGSGVQGTPGFFMSIRSLLFVLCGLLIAGPAAAQEVELTVEWGGADNGCAVCGDDSYACSGPSGDWNDGLAEFVDPLPSGAELTGVVATLQGVGEDTETRVWLSNDPVGGTQIVESPFSCGACQPTTFSALGGSWSGYVYGGVNILWVDTTSNPEICVNSADLVLYYSEGGDDDDDAADDDDTMDDDDDAADDDDGAGGRRNSRRRSGCSLGATGGAGGIAFLILLGLGLRRRQ